MRVRRSVFLKVLMACALLSVVFLTGSGWQARADGARPEPEASRDEGGVYSMSFDQIRLAQAASESSPTYRIESSGSVAVPAGTVEKKGAYLICNVIEALDPPAGPLAAGVPAPHWTQYR